MSDRAPRLILDDLGHRGRTIAYDPSRLSPLALARLVRAAVALSAEVEGLGQVTDCPAGIAVKLLQGHALGLRQELERIGAILPRTTGAKA